MSSRAFVILFLLIGTFPSLLLAEIKETNSMHEILSELSPETDWLVLDLDNTIIMPATMFGGEEWFDFLLAKRLDDLKDCENDDVAEIRKKVVHNTIKEWGEVQNNLSVLPVEPAAMEQLQHLQKKGLRTLGLTARAWELAQRTQEQLLGANVNLTKGKPTNMALNYRDFEENLGLAHETLFVGLISSKSARLVKFLHQHEVLPKRIIFVDNKKHHLTHVEQALASFNVEFIGYRLGATDDKIAAFDQNIADKQYQEFIKEKNK